MIRLAYVRDNADPDQLGRVKLEYLGHEDKSLTDWAYVVTPSAGEGAGIFWLPEDGDLVTVGFVNNDINQPVVLGAIWNGAQPPPAEASSERRMVSRNGHAITLSDGDDDGMTLADTHGNSIVLNAEGITIKTTGELQIAVEGNTQFETQGDNTITAAVVKLNP